jgi:hypothetical protein
VCVCVCVFVCMCVCVRARVCVYVSVFLCVSTVVTILVDVVVVATSVLAEVDAVGLGHRVRFDVVLGGPGPPAIFGRISIWTHSEFPFGLIPNFLFGIIWIHLD